MRSVPMFPLGTVLFPGSRLRLRIFEERYLVMLAEVLATEDRSFGVVPITRGSEVGGSDQRGRVGTMARIVDLAPGDDQIRVMTLGRQRFEVVEWLDDDPHPAALIRGLPDLEWSADLDDVRLATENVVRRALARAAEFADIDSDPEAELDDDPVAATWQLAAMAPVSMLDQIELLGTSSTRALLNSIADATREAEAALTAPAADPAFDAELSELLDTEGGTPER